MTRKIDGIEIKCDRIVAGLIDRLIATEKQVASLRQELEEFQSRWAEASPFLIPGIGVRFAGVLEHESNSVEKEYVVIVKNTALDIQRKEGS